MFFLRAPLIHGLKRADLDLTCKLLDLHIIGCQLLDCRTFKIYANLCKFMQIYANCSLYMQPTK